MTFAVVEEGNKATDPITILEHGSGKTLSFNPGAVVQIEEARDSIRGGRYLRVALDDGRNFALAGMGFVFAPSFVSTGIIPDCPPTACMMDFDKLFRHLCYLIEDTETDRGAEAMRVIMVLLAYLDGARALGLDIAREEARVEKQLTLLEKAKGPLA